MELLITIISILVSTFWIQQGVVNYGFWVENGPGGGFIPVLFGSLVIIFSIGVLLDSVKKLKTEKGDGADNDSLTLKNFIPPLGAVVGIFMIQIVGLTFASFLFTFIWLKFLSHYSWLKSSLYSFLFAVFIYAIFQSWLNIPFPTGIAGI